MERKEFLGHREKLVNKDLKGFKEKQVLVLLPTDSHTGSIAN